MEIGVMYADASDLSITKKVETFCGWYKKSYGIDPEVCFINKEDYNNNKEEVEKIELIEVKPDVSILNNNFWIGREGMTFQSYSSIKLSGEEK